MELDKKVISKLNYSDLYYLLLILERRKTHIKSNNMEYAEEYKYLKYLNDLNFQLVNYLDEKLKKLGDYNGEKNVSKN